MAAEDLISLAEAKTWLKISGTADDTKIATLITRASQWCEQITRRTLKSRAVTNLRMTGPRSTKLYVPLWPIDTAQAVTIKLDEVSQTVWRTESDGDVDGKDVVCASDDPWDERFGKLNHFYRAAGWQSGYWWAWPGRVRGAQYGQNRLLLSYTGGYATVPEDLRQACLYIVQQLWRHQEKQETGVTAITFPAGGTITMPERQAVPVEAREILSLYARPVMAAV
jgi:hypothetical protein